MLHMLPRAKGNRKIEECENPMLTCMPAGSNNWAKGKCKIRETQVSDCAALACIPAGSNFWAKGKCKIGERSDKQPHHAGIHAS